MLNVKLVFCSSFYLLMHFSESTLLAAINFSKLHSGTAVVLFDHQSNVCNTNGCLHVGFTYAINLHQFM